MEKYLCVMVRADNRESDLKCLTESIMQDENIRLAEDWSGTDAADMLRQIVDTPTFPKSFTVFIEIGYVDRVYRDIYYHHYASRHFSQSRNCLRLFFFEGVGKETGDLPENAEDIFIGVSVIQPNGIIGRSYWNPRYFLTKEHYVRTADFTVALLGKKLHVKAFPYMMQDREATTCAEVTILNLVDYYSQSYMEYRSLLLSDIERIEAQHSAERIFPSQGMNYADVARSLTQAGLSPRIYINRISSIAKDAMQRYLYYYVESGIPFGIAVESMEQGILHSMVCVGHGPRSKSWPEDSAVNYLSKELNDDGGTDFRTCWIANSADAYSTFVVMDDNDTPYQTVRLEAASENWTFPQRQQGKPTQYAVEQLCVPLYKRVFLEVDGAAEVFSTFLTSRMGFQAVMERIRADKWLAVGQQEENPLIVRMFLASSRTFLYQRMRMLRQMNPKNMDNQCIEVYQNLYCPRFVWVCELYTKDTFLHADNPRPIGEIVVDATARRTGSIGGLDSIVLVHYPHYITYRDPNSSWAELESNEQKLDVWSPIEQFRGNLRDFNSDSNNLIL